MSFIFICHVKFHFWFILHSQWQTQKRHKRQVDSIESLQSTPILTISSTAILSVYQKDGLLDLAKGLVAENVRLLASGGTARMIREAGFPVE